MKRITLLFTLLGTFFLVLQSLSSKAQGLDFDGIDDYVIMSTAGPSGNSNRTVECWIKTSNSISSQQVLIDWGSMSPLGSRFTVNLINNGRLRIEVGGNGINSNTQIADGLWHHIAVTYDNGATTKFRLYIDGVLDISGNLTVATNTTTTQAIQLGRRNDGVNFYEGEMDEVRIWNTVRTPLEIAADMSLEYCTIPAGLVAYYKLNEGVPSAMNVGVTLAMDLATGMNNGTLTNFSLTGSSSNWSASCPIVPFIDTTISQVGHLLMANDTSATSYLWYDCGRSNTLFGDTLQTFTPSVNGTYAVILTRGVCVDTSACFNFLSVGMNELEENHLLRGFPNPTKDIFTLQLPESLQNKTSEVSLFSLEGKLILRTVESSFSNSLSLNLDQVPNGIYSIRLTSEGLALVGKVIVER